MAAVSWTLKGPDDWELFESGYINKVSTEGVSHLAWLSDPSEFSQRSRQQPSEPLYSDYQAKIAVEPGTIRTRFVRGDRPATMLSELVPEDQEAIEIERDSYDDEKELFNREAEAIRNVFNWMTDHVSEHYIQTCMPALNNGGGYNISLFFLNLKAACGITDELLRRRARRTYLEVLEKATGPDTDWEAWITQWVLAVGLAKLRRVAAAQDSATWFQDLEMNLSNRFDLLLRIEGGLHRHEIAEGNYLPSTFAMSFREDLDWRRRSQRKRQRQKRKLKRKRWISQTSQFSSR